MTFWKSICLTISTVTHAATARFNLQSLGLLCKASSYTWLLAPLQHGYVQLSPTPIILRLVSRVASQLSFTIPSPSAYHLSHDYCLT